MLARLVICSLVALSLGAARAEAQTFTVANSGDSGDGSLRAAVAAAGDGDSVLIPASVSAPIVLTTGQIGINKSITITGAGAGTTVVDGNNASRVFDVGSDGVSHPEVTISDLTVTHGHTVGVPGGGGAVVEPFNTLHLARVLMTANNTAPGGDAGGAVFDQGGTLTIDRSTISDNVSGSDGGGVFVENFSGGSGTATISDSTISGNSTPFGRFGGGVFNFGAVVTIQRSTLSGNTSGRAGGGVAAETTTGGSGALSLVDSTVENNTTNGAGFEGGGVFIQTHGVPELLLNDTITGNNAFPGDVMHPGSPGGISNFNADGTQVVNTIVAGNFGQPNHENCKTSVPFAGDHNLEDLDTCGFHSAGDITGSDPLLTTLEDNGGPTLTRQPIPNSPAVGAADASRCPATDQRGVPYFAPNPCDIGAVDTARPGPPGTATGSGAPAKAAISRLGLSPVKFAAADRGGSIARKRRTGTTVSYRQLAAGKTTFVVRKCVRRKHSHRCRFVKAGGFTRAGTAGANRFHFTGRVRHHKLRPGRYRLDATAGTGLAKRTLRRGFRIVP
jgi:hypothetical protein